MLILEPFMGIEYNTQGSFSQPRLSSFISNSNDSVSLSIKDICMKRTSKKSSQKFYREEEEVEVSIDCWQCYWCSWALICTHAIWHPACISLSFFGVFFLSHSIYLFQFLSQYIFLTLSMHFFKCLFCNSDLLKTEETIRGEIRSPGGGAGEDNCGSQ